MEKSNYIRLSLMLGGTKAFTFNGNLRKVIKLVLFENFRNPLSIVNIVRKIEEGYGLSFSTGEIYKAIKDVKDTEIIEFDNVDPLYRKYELSPEEC